MEREEHGILIGGRRLPGGFIDPGFYMPYSIIEEGGKIGGKKLVQDIKDGKFDNKPEELNALINGCVKHFLKRR